MTNNSFTLPRGVSIGAQDTDDTFRKFKSSCFEAARRFNGRASRFASAGITPNFHQATIKNADEDITIVCNPAFKFVAFAEATNQSKLEFLENIDLARSFKLQGFVVLESEVLSEKLTKDNCSALDESELENIEYWKCRTVGEVVFNWFD